MLEELREIVRGLHPATLAKGGLCPALRALARRSTVPVDLDVRVSGRLLETAEVAAGDGVLHVRAQDDGCGARFDHGSGLVGLKDRVEALGGRLLLDSPPGAGTVLDVMLPLGGPSGPADGEHRPDDHVGQADDGDHHSPE